jgi:hypothetical protein
VEQTIPALLVAAIMILSGVLLADVTTSSVDSINQSWREIEAVTEERLGTDLSVQSTTVNGGGDQLTIELLNEGRTPIEEFEAMDVIVTYDGQDAQRYTAWLPFDDAASQPDNTWQVTSIANDYRNIGVLDTGEQMTVRVLLDPATDVGPDRWVVVATHTGISYTVYF